MPAGRPSWRPASATLQVASPRRTRPATKTGWQGGLATETGRSRLAAALGQLSSAPLMAVTSARRASAHSQCR